MKANLFKRSAVALGVLACAVVVANCNTETPEPVSPPVVAAPEPLPAPAPPPLVVKAPVMHDANDVLTSKARVLLSPGTDVDLAAQGFRSPQQFMSVAYAAKNLEIPFVVLKDNVLTKKMTLTRAIRATKKDVNAALEAARAESEARADLARKSGQPQS